MDEAELERRLHRTPREIVRKQPAPDGPHGHTEPHRPGVTSLRLHPGRRAASTSSGSGASPARSSRDRARGDPHVVFDALRPLGTDPPTHACTKSSGTSSSANTSGAGRHRPSRWNDQPPTPHAHSVSGVTNAGSRTSARLPAASPNAVPRSRATALPPRPAPPNANPWAHEPTPRSIGQPPRDPATLRHPEPRAMPHTRRRLDPMKGKDWRTVEWRSRVVRTGGR